MAQRSVPAAGVEQSFQLLGQGSAVASPRRACPSRSPGSLFVARLPLRDSGGSLIWPPFRPRPAPDPVAPSGCRRLRWKPDPCDSTVSSRPIGQVAAGGVELGEVGLDGERREGQFEAGVRLEGDRTSPTSPSWAGAWRLSASCASCNLGCEPYAPCRRRLPTFRLFYPRASVPLHGREVLFGARRTSTGAKSPRQPNVTRRSPDAEVSPRRRPTGRKGVRASFLARSFRYAT
jgi:hypothetical protein